MILICHLILAIFGAFVYHKQTLSRPPFTTNREGYFSLSRGLFPLGYAGLSVTPNPFECFVSAFLL